MATTNLQHSIDGDSAQPIELQQWSASRNSVRDGIEAEDNAVGSSLPPVDGGKQAWLFLTGCFLVETFIWGFPFSYGVLLDYYSTHSPIADNPSGISAVGTTCSGIMYILAAFVFAFLNHFPQFRRKCVFVGLVISAVAIVSSAFATKVWHLILTQGVLYAIGGTLIYNPIFFFIDEWFVKRKSFAFGVMWAGSGCGGLAGPLIVTQILERFGSKIALWSWSIGLVVFAGPFLFFVRPRIPVSPATRAPPVSYQSLRDVSFWIALVGVVIQGMGYFIPGLYMPAFAQRRLQKSVVTGSWLLAALNAASVPGVVTLSFLCDRVDVAKVILFSTFGSVISAALFWGFANSVPLLTLFAIFWGFFAGGFTACFAGTVKKMREVSPTADMGTLFGLISVARGVGNIASGPLSEVLLKVGPLGKTWTAYGSDYGILIVFTGLTAVFGTLLGGRRILTLLRVTT